MKILLVTASYRPSINGVAISLASLKRNLEIMGHRVLVLAPQNKEAKKREAGIVRYPSVDSSLVPDYPIPVSPLTINTIKRVSEFKPDLVHVHHPFHIGFTSQIFAQTLKIPLVFTYHTNYDYYTKKYVKFLPEKLKRDLVSNNVLDFCKTADLIIAPSSEIKKYLKNKLKRKRITVVPSIGDDLKKTMIGKEKIRRQLSLPLSKTVLLSVGRLAPEKSPERLVKSLLYLPDKFILVFCGTGIAESKLKKVVAKLKLGDRVIFAGNVRRNLLPLYYQAADYFFNASRSETQGIVFWEAAKFGLPIVTSDSGAAREWVTEEFGILVGPKSKELAKGVRKISKLDYKTISEKALKFSKNFSSFKSVKKLAKQYELIIKNFKSRKSRRIF